MTDQPKDVYFTGDGVRIHGLDWGGADDGTPIIMLHGVGSNGWGWDALATRLHAALGNAYHLVGIDQRGYGDSDKPADGYEPEAYARDVLAIQDAMGGKPMVLIGHSRGGWISAFIAGRWQERLSRLILLDPARLAFDSPQDAADFYGPVRAMLGPFPSEEAALAAARQHDPNAKWTPGRVKQLLHGLQQQPDGSLVSKMPAWALDKLRGARETEDRVSSLLHAVTTPTLLVVASTSPQKRLNQKLAYKEHLPHAHLEFIDTTHNMQNDLPDELAALIVDFLRS